LIELRRKADEYKWQSERTNFQPHYLLQVRSPVSSVDDHNLDKETSSAGSPAPSDFQVGPARRRGHSPRAERRPKAVSSKKVDGRLEDKWERRKRPVGDS